MATVTLTLSDGTTVTATVTYNGTNGTISIPFGVDSLADRTLSGKVTTSKGTTKTFSVTQIGKREPIHPSDTASQPFNTKDEAFLVLKPGMTN